MDNILQKIGQASAIVNDNNTAKYVKSGDMDVFSTPMMVALMEEAACNCIKPYLPDEQSSVGININVNHIKASKVGANITAKATVTGQDGKKIEFAVNAFDDGGEIGNGTHTRFIVDREKFLSRL